MSSEQNRTMLAAVYHGPNDIRVEERAIPEIEPGEALLKVASASICGTDLRILHGDHRMFGPGVVRVPGHELVGEIVHLERDAGGVSVGQRVFVAPNIGCGHCRHCVSGKPNLCPDFSAFGVTMDGGFAEYMRIPSAAILQGNLIPLDEKIDSAVGALIEPFACVLRGQEALQIHPGDTVLVIGAGPIGIMHMMLAQVQGAQAVIIAELIAERRTMAQQLGADLVVDPANENLSRVISEHTNDEGADVVIVAAPVHRAQETALELASIGGRINFFGGLPKDNPTISFNSNALHYKELLVTGTTGSSTENCRRALEIVGSERFDLSKIISARFALRDIREAFAVAEGRQALKVVVEPG